MKSLYKNNISKIAVAILFVFAGQLFQSCSKNKTEDDGPGDGTSLDGKISVKVLGIDDDEGVVLINPKSNVANKSAVRDNDGTVPSKTISFPGFDAVVSVERDVLKQPNIAIGNVPKGISNTSDLLAVSAMATDVKYRLLLYKTDGTFISSTPLVSGTPGAVDVAKGTAYNWYAISYNSTDAVPDVANPAAPTLALPGGKDVLYAKGTITIPANGPDGNTPLGITFKHSLARIAVELNTMGMFADINSAAIDVTGIVVKTGTIDLKTGSLSNLTNFTQTVDYSSFADVLAPYHDAKVAYIYTADAATTAQLTVTLKDLSLKIDDGTNRSFTASLAAHPSVQFDITPQLGKSYRALVNLVEAPLTIAGVRWARANIYYSGGHNPYRFNHTYAHTNNRNTYFSFHGLLPSEFGKDGDPCAAVYPTGIWRQASEPDFRTLVGGAFGIGSKPFVKGNVGGLNYYEYDAVGTAAPYPSNKLHFNFNGEGVLVSVLNGVISLQFGNYGTTPQIWTSTELLAIPPLVSLGAWHFQGTNTPDLGNAVLNLDLLGLGLLQSNFKNVRCVRK